MQEVERAIDEGASTRDAVTRACRAGGDCGACHHTIEEMIEERAIIKCERLTRAA